ncbi:MAG: hypothetical protein QXQ94_02150 [Candidatus Bathyarchaeia archaeon]
MSKLVRIEHTLRRWEKKYGYIGLSLEQERDLFSEVKDKRFTLKFLGKTLLERKIDDSWRIYVGSRVMEDLKVDDVLTIYQDKDGNYYVERK